jgi:hypothetical protein
MRFGDMDYGIWAAVVGRGWELRRHGRAFSGKVDTGFPQENAATSGIWSTYPISTQSKRAPEHFAAVGAGKPELPRLWKPALSGAKRNPT